MRFDDCYAADAERPRSWMPYSRIASKNASP